jgi:hypothetical protein
LMQQANQESSSSNSSSDQQGLMKYTYQMSIAVAYKCTVARMTRYVCTN